jgi:hypothetical protein
MTEFDRTGPVDHTSPTEFFEYYAKQSLTPAARERFRAIRDTILRTNSLSKPTVHDVADGLCLLFWEPRR